MKQQYIQTDWEKYHCEKRCVPVNQQRYATQYLYSFYHGIKVAYPLQARFKSGRLTRMYGLIGNKMQEIIQAEYQVNKSKQDAENYGCIFHNRGIFQFKYFAMRDVSMAPGKAFVKAG